MTEQPDGTPKESAVTQESHPATGGASIEAGAASSSTPNPDADATTPESGPAIVPEVRSVETLAASPAPDPNPAPAAESSPAPVADTTAEENARVDREVEDAMAGMAPEELAALGGDIAISGAGLSDVEGLEPGTELTGTVVGVSGDDVFLELGAKQQGVVPRSQFGKKEAIDNGRRVDVTVERYDGEAGLLLVNRKGALQRATWTNLTIGMLVEGRVTGVIKGGLELDLKGIRAFMPGSQADIAPMKDVSLLLNEVVRCEVMELDRRHKNVLVSRRKAMEKELAASKEKLKEELASGQTRRGIVRRIADFGAFVDLGGLDGLLHIRDLSWGTVGKVTDVVKEGDEVEVMVLKVDAKRERISLGLKQTLPDPWNGVGDRFVEGATISVRVVRLADFGAFAELEPGVEGLIPISEMSWSRVKSAADVVSVGDTVDCKVIRVEPEKRKLALSIRLAQGDPWYGVLESFEVQSLVTGKVTRLADFGAFVELKPGVEGLVHISELSDRRVKNCAEVVQAGQEVETRIIGVDAENRRISLSIRQVAAPDAGGAEVAAYPAAEEHKPKKRKKPLRGGLSSHFNW